jgi:hypothetical protein
MLFSSSPAARRHAPVCLLHTQRHGVFTTWALHRRPADDRDHGGSPGHDYSFAGGTRVRVFDTESTASRRGPWRPGINSRGTTSSSCTGPRKGLTIVNWTSSPKPRSVAARLEQFPLRCVCLSTTTRPRSASRPIFVGRAIERTARLRPTAPFNEGVRPFSTQARKGAGSVSFVTRSGRRRLSSVVQLTTAHFSLLLPPTRRSLSHLPFPPHLDNSRPDRAACPSAVRIHRRRSSPPSSSLPVPFSRLDFRLTASRSLIDSPESPPFVNTFLSRLFFSYL